VQEMDEVLMAIGCIDDFELEEVDDDDPTIKRLKESHQLYIDIQKTVWGAQE
jgi:beta-galactosidase beta subunit